jgi:hypothetical protein
LAAGHCWMADFVGGFRSSDRAHHARGRAAKLRQVSETMSSSGGRSSEQHAVWDELARTSEGFDIRSETAATSDIFEQRRASIDDHVARLTPQARQVGAIFAVDGKPLLERLSCKVDIDHDYIATVYVQSGNRGASNEAEFHRLEFALAIGSILGHTHRRGLHLPQLGM